MDEADRTKSSSSSLRELPKPPKSKAVDGFQNPLFVREKESSINPTKVEYAKVNKKRPPQPANVQSDVPNGTLEQNSSFGFYEEISHNNGDTNNKDPTSKSSLRDLNQNDIPHDGSSRRNTSDWRSTDALKRSNGARIGGGGGDSIYSEIDETDTAKRDNNINKKKLNRIASAKGSFNDLKFDTTNDQLTANSNNKRIPIYHNSSIPTTPITTLGDPINLTSSPNVYEDAPRSSATDTISSRQQQTYQQPQKHIPNTSSNKSDSIYNVPPSLPIAETYDVVPQNKRRNTRSSSVYANYRRPVPVEISLKRLPFNLMNYSNARDPNVQNHSSPAFSLLFANYYLQTNSNTEHESHDEEKMEDDLLAKARILMRTAEDMWSGLDDNGAGTSVDEAGYILKSALRKDDIAFQLGEEKSWNTEQGIGGVSPYDALHSIYNKCIESTKKSCLVLTFSHGKTCICLFDGHGNQTFLDYNIHYKNNQQAQTRAVDDDECGGVVVKCSKRNSDSMLNYILTNMCLEMKADARCGNVVPVHHKHHYLGETSPPLDFI